MKLRLITAVSNRSTFTTEEADLQGVFYHRLAGLTDGEGCFLIVRKQYPSGKKSYACQFRIRMRADDSNVLEHFCEETGLGFIYHQDAYTDGIRANSPTVNWIIGKKADCLKLVDIFDEYPLWSKKAYDYVVWREAVILWANRKRGDDVTELEERFDELAAMRAYRA